MECLQLADKADKSCFIFWNKSGTLYLWSPEPTKTSRGGVFNKNFQAYLRWLIIWFASLLIRSLGVPSVGFRDISSPLICFRMSTVQQPTLTWKLKLLNRIHALHTLIQIHVYERKKGSIPPLKFEVVGWLATRPKWHVIFKKLRARRFSIFKNGSWEISGCLLTTQVA